MCLRLLRSGTRGPDPLVERHAAHGVLLPQQQIRQARGHRAGVLVLVQRPAAVLHAVRDIDQQRAAQVGVFLVLLDVAAGPAWPRPSSRRAAGRRPARTRGAAGTRPTGRSTGCGACRDRKPFDDVPGPQSPAGAIRLIASGCKNLLESGVTGQLVFLGGSDCRAGGRRCRRR